MDKQITVLAAADIDTLESKGADVEDICCETVASAKKRARYLLTEEYRSMACVWLITSGDNANEWHHAVNCSVTIAQRPFDCRYVQYWT